MGSQQIKKGCDLKATIKQNAIKDSLPISLLTFVKTILQNFAFLNVPLRIS